MYTLINRSRRVRLHSMRLCAITDGNQLANIVDLAVNWAAGGVHFIQLREKGLDATKLVALVHDILETMDRRRSKLLVNVASADAAVLALMSGADGVHLAGTPLSGAARSVRRDFRNAIISVPCHRLGEVELANREQVDLILFSPIFEKLSAPPQGLEALARACKAAQGIPVFALGGVTTANARECIAAGAAGVAGIRLFAGDEWRQLSSPGLDI